MCHITSAKTVSHRKKNWGRMQHNCKEVFFACMWECAFNGSRKEEEEEMHTCAAQCSSFSSFTKTGELLSFSPSPLLSPLFGFRIEPFFTREKAHPFPLFTQCKGRFLKNFLFCNCIFNTLVDKADFCPCIF